jgi:hypothetical protein
LITARALTTAKAPATMLAIEGTPEPTPLGSDFIDLVVRESA